jgi:hypothetical protein
MLRVGDKVIIGSDKNNSSFNGNGTLLDMKWNLGLVKLESGETEWFELTRIYKAAK